MTTNPKRKIPPHYVIRTPIILVDDDSMKTLVACMCSARQRDGSWFVEEGDLTGRKTACYGYQHTAEAAHGPQKIISFAEAHAIGRLGTIGDEEGFVLLAVSDILKGLAELRRPTKARKAS